MVQLTPINKRSRTEKNTSICISMTISLHYAVTNNIIVIFTEYFHLRVSISSFVPVTVIDVLLLFSVKFASLFPHNFK